MLKTALGGEGVRCSVALFVLDFENRWQSMCGEKLQVCVGALVVEKRCWVVSLRECS
jgi:hypothetical protein